MSSWIALPRCRLMVSFVIFSLHVIIVLIEKVALFVLLLGILRAHFDLIIAEKVYLVDPLPLNLGLCRPRSKNYRFIAQHVEHLVCTIILGGKCFFWLLMSVGQVPIYLRKPWISAKKNIEIWPGLGTGGMIRLNTEIRLIRLPRNTLRVLHRG